MEVSRGEEGKETFEFVVNVLQQDSDDLDDGEDQRAERQSTCVIPERQTDRQTKSESKAYHVRSCIMPYWDI